MKSSTSQARGILLTALQEEIAAGADPRRLADDLFVMVAAVDGEPALSRILTEPTVPAAPKRTLLEGLLRGKADGATIKVVDASVGNRWSHRRDLGDSLEYAAVTALATAAARDGSLDDLEDTLFRFRRIVESQPALRDALADAAVPREGKRELLRSLLGGKVSEPALRLIEQVVSGRHRTVAGALAYYQEVVAEYAGRLVATVVVAAPMSPDHRERLARALAAEYSQDVHLDVLVDPNVLGGVRVSIGDDLIDSTVQTRLAQAQRRVTG